MHSQRKVSRYLARDEHVVGPAASGKDAEDDDGCEEGEEHADDRTHPHAHAALRKDDERRLRVGRAWRGLHGQADAAADDDEDHEDDASNDSSVRSARKAGDVVGIPVVRGASASHVAGADFLGGSRRCPRI
jgi:hypothetical protein